MKAVGTEIKIHTLRLTETDRYGETDGAEVRSGRFRVGMTPVIEAGVTRHDYWPCGCIKATFRGMDTFQYFELMLKDRRLWRRDRRLSELLKGPCAFEFWTSNELLDPGHPWIHWCFPYTTWEKIGYGCYAGQSHTAHNDIRPSDFPDNETDIKNGGFWKTTVPPPS